MFASEALVVLCLANPIFLKLQRKNDAKKCPKTEGELLVLEQVNKRFLLRQVRHRTVE